MTPISAVIITFNEAKNIERCLLSLLPVVDEIIVLDSFSTDATEIICQKHAVLFYQHKFDGHIEQKNRALTYANNNHIISLDADEVLTTEAQKEIIEVKKKWLHDGYSFPRLNNYCGTWIRYSGWYPDRKLRLFDRTKGSWKGQNPHDKYEINSRPELKLKGNILHYGFYTEEEHLDQINKFTKIGAKALFEKGVRYNRIKKYTSAFAIFFGGYLLKLGFLDGTAGWKIASNSFKAKLIKYNRLKDLQHESTTPQ